MLFNTVFTATERTCEKCGKVEWIGSFTDYDWPDVEIRAIWD